MKPTTRLLSDIDDSPRPGQRPVTLDDAMDVLKCSIHANGLLQPPLILENGQVIAGFRRIFACRQLKLESISVIEYPNDTPPAQIQVIRLTENLMREDLTELQKYLGVSELKSLGIPQKDIAQRLGVTPATVSKWCAPDSGPPEAKAAFMEGLITLDKNYRVAISPLPLVTLQLFRDGKTTAEAEAVVKEMVEQEEKPAGGAGDKPPKQQSFEIALHGATITLKAPKIDWEAVKVWLGDATKMVEKARTDGLTMKNASNAWADRAKMPRLKKEKT